MSRELLPEAHVENREKESRESLLSILRENLREKKWRRATALLIAWAWVRIKNIEFEGTEKSSAGVVCSLEGDKNKKVEFVPPDSFGKEWEKEKILIQDSRLERFVFDREDGERSLPEDPDWKSTARAFLEESGMPEDPTPEEALIIVREGSVLLDVDPVRLASFLKEERGENLANVYFRDHSEILDGEYKVSLIKDTDDDGIADGVEMTFDHPGSTKESENEEKLELLESIGKFKERNLISEGEFAGMHEDINEQLTSLGQ